MVGESFSKLQNANVSAFFKVCVNYPNSSAVAFTKNMIPLAIWKHLRSSWKLQPVQRFKRHTNKSPNGNMALISVCKFIYFNIFLA